MRTLRCDCRYGSFRRNRPSAQGGNLTGPYRCVEACLTARPGLAFIRRTAGNSTW